MLRSRSWKRISGILSRKRGNQRRLAALLVHDNGVDVEEVEQLPTTVGLEERLQTVAFDY